MEKRKKMLQKDNNIRKSGCCCGEKMSKSLNIILMVEICQKDGETNWNAFPKLNIRDFVTRGIKYYLITHDILKHYDYLLLIAAHAIYTCIY